MNPGLYYEDEPMYNDALNPSKETIINNVATVSDIPPIKIEENLVTNIELPPIVWHGFDVIPKILNVTNTGQTILINGQWPNGKPYIEGGPLNGTYIFSQIHFHSPSEHEVAGKRYPLEMHVVHYKTSYLTQERAMHEKDGTVVLVYLFEILGTCPSSLSSVTKLAPQIEKVNSRTETTNVPLEQIVQPFTSNYYVYWGSVSTESNSYLLQWIINGCILFVTNEEAEDLLSVMNFDHVSAKHLTRMKPQNNKIFYIKELVNEEKNLDNENILENVSAELTEITDSKEENQANKCHTGVQSDIDGFAVIKFLLGEMGEICGGKCKCKSSKSYSGLRGSICCHKREGKPVKSKTKTCISPSDLPTEKSSECIEEKNSEKDCYKSQNVSTDSEPQPVSNEESCKCDEPDKSVECDEPVKSVENEDEEGKLSVVVASPPKKKSKEKSYKRKKKKSTESSNVETVLSSSASERSVKEKKKKKKKEPKETPSGKKKKGNDSAKKPKKKDKKKKQCESEEAKSTSGSKSSKESMKSTFAVDMPLECRVATVIENNYEAALTDLSFKDLDDSDCLTVDQLSIASLSDSKCKDVLSTLKSSFRSDCSSFTTLFEKSPDTKVPDISNENCSINVILPPVNMRKNASSFVLNQKTDSGEGKFFPNTITQPCSNASKLDVTQITCSGVKEPESLNNGNKEFCVHVDVLFRSQNGDASKCLAQEYNLTLIYNQNILQEYRGILHPSILEVGNYEKLELLPKYPELDNINIELQDCTVKMESLDEISMRAKFLLKEISLKEEKMLTECGASSERKMVSLTDAETQYCINETDLPVDNTMIDMGEPKLKDQLSFLKSERSHSQTVLGTDPLPLKYKTSSLDSILQNADLANVGSKMKPMSNTEVLLGEGTKTTSNIVKQYTQSEKEEGLHKHLTKESEKKLKEPPFNKKKTVYFMYDKIEKDKNSGKKIFVGSFRSKDEFQKFPNEEKLKSNGHCNEGKAGKLLLLAKNNTKSELNDSMKKECKIVFPIRSKNLSKKDVVTVHKSRSKTLRSSSSKKERLNLVLSKVIKLDNENIKLRRLANLVGIDKGNPKTLTFYELKKHPETSATNTSSPCTSAPHDDSPCTSATRTKIISDFPDRSPPENSESKWYKFGKSKKYAPVTVKSKVAANLPKHRSKSAVIVIPVEVDSLSKIEVILVEHNESFRRSLRKSERGIIPCLNYNERSSSM